MASRQQEFYGRVYNDARAAGLSDPQARLAASQASLETGYGKSSVGNNYFGIKAGKSWNGPSVNAGTWEDGPGGAYTTRANFRSYSNPFDSFRDWASQLGRNWPSSFRAGSFDEAVDGLGDGVYGRYATDRNYESKLRSIDRQHYGPELGIMSVIDPPTPSPRPNGSINAFDAILAEPQQPSFPATTAAVQREAIPDVSPLAFDSARFGAPATQNYFDPIGLLDQPADFDASRFGIPSNVATTPQQLQRGLLDQQLDAGELPGLLGPATSWPGQMTTAATGYVDPRVTTEPASIKTARVQPPEQPEAVRSGLLSPSEFAQVQQQQGLLGGPLASSTPAQLANAAARNQQAMQRQNLLGALGGGLLGGLVLGPVGAVAGGLLGKNVAARNYFPEAPKPDPKSKSTNDRSLNDYGRSVANTSGQFSRAMSKGGVGLY